MKIAVRILSLLVLIGFSTYLIGCKSPDPEPVNKKDEQITKLNGTWTVSTVTLDGGQPDLDHDNMTITLSGTAGSSIINYTVSNRPALSAWPSSGTLTFVENDVEKSLMRQDDVLVSYTVSANALTLSFNYNGDPISSGGRTSSVAGDWVFNFTK